MVWFVMAVLGALGIIWEDLKRRSVHILWYPVLLMGLSGLKYGELGLRDWMLMAAINFSFVLILLLLLTLYFSIKQGRVIKIMDSYIGWGDILFFLVICVYFSLEGYVFFTICSILFTLIITPFIFIWQGKEGHVPLAGMQAVCLCLYISMIQFDLLTF